jgi:hypothetical protein
LDPDPDQGGPHTYGSCGSGSTTLNKNQELSNKKNLPEGIFLCVYSDSFELVVLTEQIEGEEGLDFEDHLLLVRQRVVADRVRHHHGQLKLHRKTVHTNVANSWQIFRPYLLSFQSAQSLPMDQNNPRLTLSIL